MNGNGFWNAIGKFFQEVFKKYFSGILEGYGIVGIPAVIIAVGLAYFLWKALFAVVKPAPDIHWNRLNPDDRVSMEKSFSDLRIVMALAKKIDGNTAESVDDFTAQIRSLQQFGVPGAETEVWGRVDYDDDKLVQSLFAKHGVAEIVASRLNKKSATTTEDFKQQLIELRAHAFAAELRSGS